MFASPGPVVHANHCCAQLHRQRCWPSTCRSVSRTSASKGFGKVDVPTKVSPAAGDKVKAKQKKGKGKNKARTSQLVAPGQLQQQQQEQGNRQRAPPRSASDLTPDKPLQDRFRQKVEAKQEGVEDSDIEFEKRLADLKRLADAKKRQAASQGSVLDLTADIYDNPPPLSQTLFSQGDPQPAAQEQGSAGPNQIALGAGAIVLVGIFVLGGLGGDGPTRQPKPDPMVAAQAQLAEDERAALQSQAASFDARYAEAPADTEALEGAAVSHAQLGEYSTAVALLDKLSQQKPKDPDVWRLLGESRNALGESAAAVKAYEKALEVGSFDDLTVLKGLASSLIADGKAQKAADVVMAARDRANSDTASSSGNVELNLLLAKVYSQWRGHRGDAYIVYDRLIQEHPEDFRGYLAKGVLLSADNQKGDAQRMFLQARYYAPKEARRAVDAIVSARTAS